MAYVMVWLFGPLFFLLSAQSLAGIQPDIPRVIPSSSVFYPGVQYSFICLGQGVVTNFTFYLNGVSSGNQSEHYLTLGMEPDFDGHTVQCSYTNTNFDMSSETSAPVTLTLTALPTALLSAVNASETITLSVPYELECMAPSDILIPYVTRYYFRLSEDGNSNTQGSVLAVLPVTPTQGPVGVSCAYQIAGYVSPYSQEVPVTASAITVVRAMPSVDTAYFNQEVTFTCQVDLHSTAVAPPGGNIFVYRWYDGGDGLAPELVQATHSLRLDADLTYSCAASANNDIFVVSDVAVVPELDFPAPTVIPPSTPFYFAGFNYTFVCSSAAETVVTFTTYEWFSNSTKVAIISNDNEYHLIIPDPPFQTSISCTTALNSTVSTQGRGTPVASTGLPSPEILAANDTQELKHGHSFELICNAPSVVIPYITAYHFMGVADDSSLENVTSANFSYIATVSQFQRYNYTCSYEAEGVVSPVSDNSYSLLATIITRVTTVASMAQAYTGEFASFTCQVDTDPDATPPIGGDIYTVRWFDGDGSWITNAPTGVTYQVAVQSNITDFSCHAAVNNDLYVMGSPTSIQALSLPIPTILPPATPNQFVLAPQELTCNSGLQRHIPTLLYQWSIDGQLQPGQISDMEVFSLPMPRQYIFTCNTFLTFFTSDSSPAVPITVTIPPPPSIQLLAEPSHYLVGTEYELECQSDQEALVTMFCLENFDLDAACQISKRFSFTPEESEQRLTCYLQFGSVNTTDSTFVSITGSGIVDLTASADNLSPYPGTNVTLTCNPTLTTGYVESDVTFSWKEDARLTAQTKVITEYVTIDMVKSFECEGTTGMVDVTSNVLTITARDLPMPSLEVQNQPADDNYEPGHFYPLNCNSELEDLLTSYNWYRDGQLVEDVHTKQYLIQAMSYTHVYTCTYVIVTEESPRSSSVTIATESILSVQVESNGLIATTLIPAIDSTVTLSCEATIKPTATESPTYIWLERGVQVGTGQEVAIVAYAGYDHPVVCEVTVGDDVMESNRVNITSTEDLPSPEISLTTHQVNEVLPRASYTLNCISSSLSLNTTVTWYKDFSQLLCLHDLTLDITRYDPSIHDGQYACEISTFGITAMSEPTTLLAIAPGKPCASSALCSVQGEGYIGVCRDQRCVCSDGYQPRLKECVRI